MTEVLKCENNKNEWSFKKEAPFKMNEVNDVYLDHAKISYKDGFWNLV